MKESKKTYLFHFILVLLLIGLDQWTKHLALVHLFQKPDVVLIPGVLQLHYLENSGAAFSLLKGQLLLFYILTPMLCLLILYIYVHLPATPKTRMLQFLFAVILAGAAGNYIDRLLHHYVIDFIYFSLIDFPVFNLADIYVSCSVVLLFIMVLFLFSEEELNTILQSLKERKRI